MTEPDPANYDSLYDYCLAVGAIEPPTPEETERERILGDLLSTGRAELPDGTVIEYEDP